MNRRTFLLLAALLAVAYLAIEVVYVLRLPLVMDEFQGAATVARLAEEVPYRDFLPYKTLLGYYLQLPVLLLSPGTWSGLMAVKLEMALLVALTLFALAAALRRHFRGPAVLLGLLLLVCMSTFLERSADLRVDTLTAIAGLASLCLLLRQRWLRAGLVCGLSFLISQKGVYYALAANGGLALAWWVRERSLAGLRPLARFNAALAAAILAYLALWSIVASPSRVFEATFLSHAEIALGGVFSDIRALYWRQTLLRNPLFWTLAVLALVGLRERGRRETGEALAPLLGGYGIVLLALGLWHRQPWPYFFVLLIPTAAVLAIAGLDELSAWWETSGRAPRAALVVLLVLVGVLYPLSRMGANLARSSAFQEDTVRLASALLEPEDSYLAGLELLWDHPQKVPRLGWIDRARMNAIRAMSGPEAAELMSALDRAPVKLVVESYRVRFLPTPLLEFLNRRYQRLWGNVLLYAPLVSDPGAFELRFAGRYAVLAPEGVEVSIDDRPVVPGDVLELAAGGHRLDGGGAVRLRLMPADSDLALDPRFREPRDLFPNVYGY